jgi:hypothetical protein
VQLARGDDAGAEAALVTATQDPSSRGEALRELVRLAHRRGDRDAAARWLPDALLADPTTANDPAIRDALGLPAAAGE